MSSRPLSFDTIQTVLSRKLEVSESPKYLWWALVNVLVAAFLYRDVTKWDACSCIFSDSFGRRSVPGLTWGYIETGIIAVLVVCCFINLYRFARPLFRYPPMQFSQKERILLGIKEGEPGFDVEPPKPTASRSSLSPPKPHLLSPSRSPSSSIGSGSVTPMNLSATSWMSSGSPYSPWSSFASSEPRASFHLGDASTPSSVKSDTAIMSPKAEFERRMRRDREAVLQKDSFEPWEYASSEADLSRLMEKDYRSRAGILSASRNLAQSFRDLTHSQEQADGTPPKRFVYQLAPTSSSAPGATGRGKDETSSISSLDTFVFATRKLGISPEKLDLWTEHLRKWISETIVRPVHKEIEAVNDRLKALGAGESMRIGSMSLMQVAALAVTGHPGVPSGSTDFASMHALIPFLEAHPNQEYLVRRIATLAKKGYLGEYRWNRGDSFDGKEWGEHLPSDAVILMHLFASYFDVHLPLTTFESPRPFTYNYVLKRSSGAGGGASASSSSSLSASAGAAASGTSVGPGGMASPAGAGVADGGQKVVTSVGSVVVPEHMRDNPVICVADTSPPHFVFVYKGEVCEAGKGRNNLFHTILLFLHHVKTNNGGMLGRVNLGLSGINVLWILD